MSDNEKPLNFIQQIVADDLANGRVDTVVTRFPPEPNGFLHIGHAKSICLNFGLAEQFGGKCRLRFDDTNPEKEEQRYIDAIKRDIEWLGFRWDGEVRFASSYFEQLYEWALYLIGQEKAYVCELSQEQAREMRGTLTEPGRNSPYRDRTVEENLALFERMRAGELAEGSAVLRARIDMAHPNINMRDPVLYRIRHREHHQTGNRWKIYPSYDFGHGQGDAIEGVTHSICTLEFADHRPLYDWFIENLPVPARPRQYEFARLNPNYTITSKRRLRQLVDEGIVDGWDDPRMPTLAGMRRAGYTPRAIRNFCDMIGVTKANSVVDIAMLDFALRDDLDKNAPRAMCVLRPLRLVLTNFADHAAELTAPCHPVREELGERQLAFGPELWIERDDFREEANKKFKRLVLGKRVRLRYAYVVEAESVERDANGDVSAVYARIVEDTLGRDPDDGIKPKGVIHWVSATDSAACEVRLYERMFDDPAPDAPGKDFLSLVRPGSLEVVAGAKVESTLANAQPDTTYQFERLGYFCRDSGDHDGLVFNRTIGLRDSWSGQENG